MSPKGWPRLSVIPAPPTACWFVHDSLKYTGGDRHQVQLNDFEIATLNDQQQLERLP